MWCTYCGKDTIATDICPECLKWWEENEEYIDYDGNRLTPEDEE